MTLNGVPADGVIAISLLTHTAVSISRHSPIEEGARTMQLNNIRHLTMKDPLSHEVAGMITVRYLARYLKLDLAVGNLEPSEVRGLF